MDDAFCSIIMKSVKNENRCIRNLLLKVLGSEFIQALLAIDEHENNTAVPGSHMLNIGDR